MTALMTTPLPTTHINHSSCYPANHNGCYPNKKKSQDDNETAKTTIFTLELLELQSHTAFNSKGIEAKPKVKTPHHHHLTQNSNLNKAIPSPSYQQVSLFDIPKSPIKKRKPKLVQSLPLNHIQLNLWTDTDLVSQDENLLLHFWLAMTHRDSEQFLRVNTAMTQYWTDEQYQVMLGTIKPFLKEEEEFWLITLLRGCH